MPMKPFVQNVRTVDEGKLLLVALARYDEFQFKNRIKPDYSNAGGLEVFEDGEWTDWNDADGNSIDDSTLIDDVPDSTEWKEADHHDQTAQEEHHKPESKAPT